MPLPQIKGLLSLILHLQGFGLPAENLSIAALYLFAEHNISFTSGITHESRAEKGAVCVEVPTTLKSGYSERLP